MGIKRRDFLKIAGASALAGIGGAAGLTLFKSSILEASQYIRDPKELKGKRWALAIDMEKFKAPEDYQKVMDACHTIHNVPDIKNPKDEIKWIWTESYQNTFPTQEYANPYIKDNLKKKPFLVLCNHCDNPPCVRVCPTKATFKRKSDGIVMMDMHRCIGCRFCMAGCPYGARSFNWIDPRPHIKKVNPEFPARMKGVVEKCTFCYERIAVGLKPACAEASNGGIIFGDLNDPDSEIRKILASRYSIRRKPELGTTPCVFYIIGG